MTPLRQRMIDEMQLRHIAPGTQTNYVHHVEAFARYYWRTPEELDLESTLRSTFAEPTNRILATPLTNYRLLLGALQPDGRAHLERLHRNRF